MSNQCEVCGKKRQSGNTVSHAHNINLRLFNPNIRTLKTKINGTAQKIKICMKCLKTMAK